MEDTTPEHRVAGVRTKASQKTWQLEARDSAGRCLPLVRAGSRPRRSAGAAVGINSTRIGWAEGEQGRLSQDRVTDAGEGDPREAGLRMSGILGNGPRNRNQSHGLDYSSSSESMVPSLRCQADLPLPSATAAPFRALGSKERAAGFIPAGTSPAARPTSLFPNALIRLSCAAEFRGLRHR